ncbi:MAG: T9SS type A sorting domain-containing protein [Bacteroidota bacterium]
MKKNILLLFCICFLLQGAKTQNVTSFYLDTVTYWNRPLFTDDAVYFFTYDFVTKMDYDGNVSWAKQTPTPIWKMTVRDNVIYALSGTKVIKLDTAGNTIWVKNFSAHINPASTDDNSFNDILFDGSRIYLNEMQAPAIQQAGVTDYPSILVLDTSGTVLHVSTHYVQPGGGFSLQSSIASLQGGAWIGYNYAPGFTHHSYIVRIDTIGDYDLSALNPGFSFQTVTFIQNIITMTDSTYLVLSWSNDYNQGIPAGFFSCSKINEHGSAIWQYGYWDNTFTCGDHGTDIVSAATDSIGNIYLMGLALEYPCAGPSYRGIFCLKLNSQGDVLFTKFYGASQTILEMIDNYSNNDGFNFLHYANGHLYCAVNSSSAGGYSKPTILVFDTLFSNSCFDPDSTINLNKVSLPLSTNPITSTPPVISYASVNDTFTINPMINFNSWGLCMALTQSEIKTPHSKILVSPNPFHTSATIQIDGYENKNCVPIAIGMEIYNTLGMLVRKQATVSSVSRQEIQIERGELNDGLYFFQLTSNNEKLASGKFVIE